MRRSAAAWARISFPTKPVAPVRRTRRRGLRPRAASRVRASFWRASTRAFTSLFREVGRLPELERERPGRDAQQLLGLARTGGAARHEAHPFAHEPAQPIDGLEPFLDEGLVARELDEAAGRELGGDLHGMVVAVGVDEELVGLDGLRDLRPGGAIDSHDVARRRHVERWLRLPADPLAVRADFAAALALPGRPGFRGTAFTCAIKTSAEAPSELRLIEALRVFASKVQDPVVAGRDEEAQAPAGPEVDAPEDVEPGLRDRSPKGPSPPDHEVARHVMEPASGARVDLDAAPRVDHPERVEAELEVSHGDR